MQAGGKGHSNFSPRIVFSLPRACVEGQMNADARTYTDVILSENAADRPRSD